MTDEGQHEHTPECFERVREYRKDRAEEVLRLTPEHKREETLQAAHGAADMVRTLFPDLTAEDQAGVLETMAALIGQIMFVPTYELSDTLTDSTAAYVLGAASVTDAYELPESAEQIELPEPPQASEAPEALRKLQNTQIATAAGLSEDELRNTGMFL